jgi:predicted nucleotidyltransferase
MVVRKLDVFSYLDVHVAILGGEDGTESGWCLLSCFINQHDFGKEWGLEMTVQIKGVRIAGISALTIRNMLRGVNELVCAEYVAQRCKVPLRRAKQIVKTLVSEGYLEFDKRYKQLANPYVPGKEKPRYRHVPYYKLTVQGGKLAQASALNKMPRERAEPILAGLLRRVEEVNATPHYLFRIPTVIVYGSYVRGEAFLSDVDIAVDLEPKWERASKEFEVQSKKRVDVAEAKGRRFSNIVEYLYWPEREVMLHLKARTRGLSLHPMDDFVGMRKDNNFAYKILIGDADKIAEQLAKQVAANATPINLPSLLL